MPTTSTVEATSYPCRLLRHAWDIVQPGDPLLQDFSTIFRNTLHLKCLRCEALRHDSFDTSGRLQVRKYDYPENYRLDQDERPSQEQLRLWMMKRTTTSLRRRAPKAVPDQERKAS